MRFALLADIHGNADALEAVLRDVRAQGPVDGILVLGDLVAFGPDSGSVAELLAGLRGATCIAGNTDPWVATGDTGLPPPSARTDEELVRWRGLARICGWTAAELASRGMLGWLAALPPEVRLELPGGTRLLGVHGSPASADEGIGSRTAPDRLVELARLARADVVVSGHTHVAFEAEAGGVRFHVLGSVSNPKGADRSACYSILAADAGGWTLSRRRVVYDTDGVVSRARAALHPALQSIEQTFGPAGKGKT